MSFRPTFTVSFVFLAVATSAYVGWPHSSAPSVSAQESPAGVSGASDSSIQDKLELAQIRLAIRLQEVEIAKVERRLLVTGSDGANEALNAKEQELMIADTQYTRLKEFHELGNIALEKLQEAEAKRLTALAEVASCRSNIAAHREKLLVHDETIKLLELRAQLAQTKLDQLKRQQK
jgi:hypothetical protein